MYLHLKTPVTYRYIFQTDSKLQQSFSKGFFNSAAAKKVRTATTAIGEKPRFIALFPKTGASPKKTAEQMADEIPF